MTVPRQENKTERNRAVMPSRKGATPMSIYEYIMIVLSIIQIVVTLKSKK